jgi:hypothetical protein
LQLKPWRKDQPLLVRRLPLVVQLHGFADD